MATPDERKILKFIDEKGGESHEVSIANEIGVRLVYARTILTSMGEANYVDVFRSGKVMILDKGWRVLGKSPRASWAGGQAEDDIEMTPQEKFERYMSRGAEEESSPSGTQEKHERSSQARSQTSSTTSKLDQKSAKDLEKKEQKAPGEGYRKTLEELEEESSLTPEEKFKRYMSK